MGRKKKRSENGFQFPQYLNTNDRTVEVVGVSDGNPLKAMSGDSYVESKGYLFDKSTVTGKEAPEGKDDPVGVWVFCASKPLHANMYPYFWTEWDKDDNAGTVTARLAFSDPAKLILKAFAVDNMHDMSIVNIIEKTVPGEELFNEQELNDINASSNFYVPIIYERDDFLKQIVKTAIIEKGININKLKSKTDEKYQIPNMTAALRNSTKMSVMYFQYWMELLQCDFSIKITDDGMPHTDKLKSPIVYQSITGKIDQEVNGKLVPLDPAKYHNVSDSEE